MKELVNGIALYGVDEISLNEALNLSQLFFEKIGIVPNSISYFYKHEQDENGETISMDIVNMSELRKKIDDGLASDFRISYFVNDLHWDISFSFSNKETVWEMNYIDIQFLDSFLNIKDELLVDILRSMFRVISVEYGIGFQLNGYTSYAFNYVFSLDNSKIFMYENASKWLYQLPFRTEEEPYYIKKLRMVYPINIVSIEHLNQPVLTKTLENWILEEKRNGQLIVLNAKNKLWIVENDELDRINNILGKAGLLISWKEIQSKPIKKLP